MTKILAWDTSSSAPTTDWACKQEFSGTMFIYWRVLLQGTASSVAAPSLVRGGRPLTEIPPWVLRSESFESSFPAHIHHHRRRF